MSEKKVNLLGFSLQSLEDFFAKIGEPRFRAKQLIKWVHQKGILDFEEMSDFNKHLRSRLKSLAILLPPKIEEIHPSPEGTSARDQGPRQLSSSGPRRGPPPAAPKAKGILVRREATAFATGRDRGTVDRTSDHDDLDHPNEVPDPDTDSTNPWDELEDAPPIGHSATYPSHSPRTTV